MKEMFFSETILLILSSKVLKPLLHTFFIGNSIAYPSAWDFGQKLSNSLASAQPQIGLFLSKQLVFAKSC